MKIISFVKYDVLLNLFDGRYIIGESDSRITKSNENYDLLRKIDDYHFSMDIIIITLDNLNYYDYMRGD